MNIFYLKWGLAFVCLGIFVSARAETMTISKIDHEEGERAVILVLGDSLSAAYNLSPEQGWVALIQENIKAEGAVLEVVNASVGGSTTSAGLQRLPALLKDLTPALVVLQLGANDGLQGKPIPHITQNLERLIVLSKTAGAQVLLLGIRLPPNYGPRYTQPFFDQYHMLADQYTLPLVPFLLEGVAGKAAFMQKDGLHPNAQGQSVIVENVWPVLQPLLKSIVLSGS